MQNIEGNTNWKIQRKTSKISSATLIVGLPGIGNVGKLVVDFLEQELKAEEYATFFSYSFPHSVFVNSDDVIELPKITLYHKKRKGKEDILLLTGDLQPTSEESCYAFCKVVDDLAKELNVRQIFTLGGIGLKEEVKKQHVYTASNTLEMKQSFDKKHGIVKKTYGSVGPIIGVSGVLVGISGIPSMVLLTETLNHPLFVGVEGAKMLLDVLCKELDIGVDSSKLSLSLKAEEVKLDKTKKLTQIGEKTSYIG